MGDSGATLHSPPGRLQQYEGATGGDKAEARSAACERVGLV